MAPVIDPMLNKRALISSSRPSRSDAAEKRQRMSVDTEVVQQSSGYPSGVDSVGLAGKHQSAPPAMLNEEDSNNHILTAYIAESVVALDSVRAWALSDRLKAFGIEKQHTRLGRVANLVLDGLTESLMLFAPGADSGAPSNGAAPLSKSSANGTSNHLLGAEYQLPAILFHGTATTICIIVSIIFRQHIHSATPPSDPIFTNEARTASLPTYAIIVVRWWNTFRCLLEFDID